MFHLRHKITLGFTAAPWKAAVAQGGQPQNQPGEVGFQAAGVPASAKILGPLRGMEAEDHCTSRVHNGLDEQG